jgi:geranylgeranyl pyrophosphate synthase
MLSISEQVEIVHRIIGENLAFCRAALFPDFAGLLATVLDGRTPSPDRASWLVLPILTCEALEGDAKRAYHVAAALEIGRIAAGCLDEWQDQDTDDALWRTVGPAQTVNLATAMIGLSQLSLTRLADLGVEPALILDLQKEFSLTLLYMCEGQHADLSDRGSLTDYEKTVGAKTGSLLSLGCRAGAMVAEADTQSVASYGEFGYNLGVLAQVWNDFSGLVGSGGKRDVDHSRTLPILAALALDGMHYQPDSAEGQAGQLYAVAQFQLLHQRTAEALARCPAPGRLTSFLDVYSIGHLLQGEASQVRLSSEGDGVE